jgi:L-alanine-DL-glutamate epimerase-like enolase superfamily enzyme
MPRQLHLGAITYRSRDYVVLRLTSESGLTGAAIGYTRNTPLFESVRDLAPHLGGFADPKPIMVADALKRRFAPGWGAIVRAASLIDIALWDIQARELAVPLADLIGGTDRDLPLMAVAGYFLDQRGAGAIVDEVREFVDGGYETIKLIVPGQDVKQDLAFVNAVAAVIPEDVALAVDFHGAFTDLEAAVSYMRAFDRHGLRFIEDPFPSYETDIVIRSAARVASPIASGEDLISTSSYRQLLAGGIGYLRVDATATGGYSAVLEGIEAAEVHGAVVAPHIWPHIHQPLASRSAAVGMLELIPHQSGSDPLDLLLQEPFPIVDGRWRPPEHQGLYLPLDWERVSACATARWAGDC